jgi:hypothetical protein
MSENCPICHNEKILPYTLSACDNSFCFLCIKSHYTNGNVKCPNCEQFITDNLNNIIVNVDIDDIPDKKLVIDKDSQNIIFWVYSSSFNNVWWCYDSLTNRHIETIYNDYVKRYNSLDSIDTNDEIDVEFYDIVKDNESTSPIDFNQFKNLPNDMDNLQKVNNYDCSFDTVQFDDKEKPEYDGEKETVDPLSYLIKIGTTKYKIDFDTMKQISTIDSSKQRKIKRIEINESFKDINVKELHDYLYLSHGVIGVAGIKFVT